MRYTVTFEVYVQGDNDKHAFSKAELIARNQNMLHPNQQWDVTELHRTPFASLLTEKVNIDAIKTEKLLKEDLPF